MITEATITVCAANLRETPDMKKKPFTTVALLFCTVLSFYLYSCSKGESIEEMGTTPAVTPCSGTPGPLFTAVRTLINSRCINCHNATSANGGMNFSVDCNIVTAKTRIKVRAVDEGTMPPNGALSAAQKSAITSWINAGGRLSD